MTPKRLVLFVEGEGDVEAAPVLVQRLLSEQGAFDVVFLDPKPFRVGEYSKICKHEFGEWRRFLAAAAKRGNLGGCLLLLDGDSRIQECGQPFCSMHAARRLAREAREVAGGILFSVAIVFACMEFESWLIAGAESLAGKPFSDGRQELPQPIPDIPPDPESAPRDAKRWFRKAMTTSYKPARDQAELARRPGPHSRPEDAFLSTPGVRHPGTDRSTPIRAARRDAESRGLGSHTVKARLVATAVST